MGNVLFERLEERGMERGKKDTQEEIAIKMIAKGMDLRDIIEITGLTTESLREMRESVHNKAVAQI